MTADEILVAARRGALTLAVDPVACLYSADTVGRVYTQLIVSLCGAGDLQTCAERMANDPALSDVPDEVIAALLEPCLRHFAAAHEPAERT